MELEIDKARPVCLLDITDIAAIPVQQRRPLGHPHRESQRIPKVRSRNGRSAPLTKKNFVEDTV